MSLTTSRQLPAQKPGRSFVVWMGRPAGEVIASVSGTAPFAIVGCFERPTSAGAFVPGWVAWRAPAITWLVEF